MTMGKLVEPGTTGNSDVGENPIYDVTCGAPSEFTEAELARYIAIIQAEDAVDPGSTARDLPRAKVIAVARKDSEIVGGGYYQAHSGGLCSRHCRSEEKWMAFRPAGSRTRVCRC